jgi:hypothetical protein
MVVPKTPRHANAVMKNRHQLRDIAFVETSQREKIAFEKVGQEVPRSMDPRLERMTRESKKREPKDSLTEPGMRT